VNYITRTFQYTFLYAALILLTVPERIQAADPYAEAARELTGKIMASVGPLEDAAVAFRSLASLGARETAAARRAIENEMRAQHIREDSQSTVKINVTLSENLQQYIWIAEIRKDQGAVIVMTTRPRMAETPPTDSSLRATIQAKFLIEQNDPILDVMLLGDELLALDPQHVKHYRNNNDRWELERSAPLKNLNPFTRDIRGRLSRSNDALQVHLPGLSCAGKIKPSLDLICSQETPWPIVFGGKTPTYVKNYFVLENLPSFFSAASMEDDGTELLAIAGIDGRTYLFDKDLSPAGTLDGWGSDIAAIDAGCGPQRQILVALPTDPMERGAIQAYEIQRRKAVAASSIVEFPGPITALWPVSNQNNQNGAIAVSRDIKSGRYAAFFLSISCSH
jgi:hypothetical protein